MNHSTRPLQHWERQGLIWTAKLSPTQKFVLLAYESFASADSHECFPSYGTIAEKTGYKKRTVMEAVSELVKLKILAKESRFRPNGSQTSNNYRIIYHTLIQMSLRGDPSAPPHYTLMHPASDPGAPPELIQLIDLKRTCVEQAENLEKQPTHTGNSDLNFEDDRSETLEQHPSETLDSGTLEQESLEIQTPVKKSKTEIEYLDLNNNPGLGISSAGARENLTSPAENAPKTRGNDLKVSNPIQPHNVPLSEFIQVYNKHRGNWRSIGVAPAPVVVAGIFGYRQSFTGTDEEFLAKFPLLLKAAQSSGGNWFKSKRNPSEIFHPDRLPLNDFWEDVQPAPLPTPEPQPQPQPSPAPTQGTIKPTFFFGEI